MVVNVKVNAPEARRIRMKIKENSDFGMRIWEIEGPKADAG